MGGSASIVCGGSLIVDIDAKCWMLSVGVWVDDNDWFPCHGCMIIDRLMRLITLIIMMMMMISYRTNQYILRNLS